jgi:hypothetical protein
MISKVSEGQGVGQNDYADYFTEPLHLLWHCA